MMRVVVLAVAVFLIGGIGAKADCTVTNLGIAPLPDLGLALYKAQSGGLYPNGRNNPPSAHLAAGMQIATKVSMTPM